MNPSASPAPQAIRPALFLAVMLAIHAPSTLAASEGDVFGLNIGQSFSYDDNVFRIPDESLPQGYSQQDDLISYTTVRGEMNKSFGRQRVYGDLGATQAKYQEFTRLDHQSYQGFLAWRMGFGTASEAGAFYRRSRAMSNFDESITWSGRNMLTTETYGGDVLLRIAGDWLGVASVTQAENRNSLEEFRSGESRVDAYDAGVRYAPRTGNYVELRYRRSVYDYFNRSGSNDYSYNQDELRLNSRWVASGRSTLDSGISLVRSRHENLDYLDFTGLAGYVAYRFKPTGATTIETRLARDVGSVGDGWGSYAKTTGLSVSPSWQATAKLELSGEVAYRHRKFDGYQALSSGNVVNDNSDRTDRIQVLRMAAKHAVTPDLSLNLGLRYEKRDSNQNTYDFIDRQVTLSAFYRF
ncbi:MAG: hypothetical protein CGU28_04905 [Candidatus Dactylopiibacterium carminicum]|nr:MAG: hypothetical protein CGU28_04905 [Candidatus Dactylopiibacterium carminicum]